MVLDPNPDTTDVFYFVLISEILSLLFKNEPHILHYGSRMST